MRNSTFWTGVLLGLASAASFGLIPLFASPLLRSGLSPETVAFYRFGLGALLICPILPLFGIKLKINRRKLLSLAILGLFYFLDVQFFFYAFQFLASGLVATLEFLAPVIVMAIMIFFFHQKFHWQAALACCLAIVGVWFLSGGMSGVEERFSQSSNLLSSSSALFGVCLSLLAALFCALYIIGCDVANLRDLHPLQITFYILLFGALYCTLLACYGAGFSLPESWQDMTRAALLALVTAIFSNVALVIAVKRVGSLLTSLMGVMEPLTAVFIGALVFDEKLSFWLALGAFLVLCATLLAIWGRQKNV